MSAKWLKVLTLKHSNTNTKKIKLIIPTLPKAP
jgi:hypothetical protein